MNPLLRIALAFVVLFSLPPALLSAEGSTRPPSWQMLESELVRAVPEDRPSNAYPTDHVFNVPKMREIRDNGTTDLWIEMARQREFPFTAVAGFLCMKAKKPEQAFEAALTVITSGATNPSVLYVYLPVTEYLKGAAPTQKNLETFTRFASGKSSGSLRRILLANALSTDFVLRWVEEMPLQNANPEQLCDLVERAVIHYEQAKKPLPPKLSATIDSFATASDMRVIAFILHAQDTDPRLKSALINLLKSEQVADKDLAVPIYKKIGYIVKNIDYRRLGLKPERRAMIEKCRSRRGL